MAVKVRSLSSSLVLPIVVGNNDYNGGENNSNSNTQQHTTTGSSSNSSSASIIDNNNHNNHNNNNNNNEHLLVLSKGGGGGGGDTTTTAAAIIDAAVITTTTSSSNRKKKKMKKILPIITTTTTKTTKTGGTNTKTTYNNNFISTVTKLNKLNNKLPWEILLSLTVWYLVGVGSICSSKLLLSQFDGVPPLVLTFQQLVIGSTFLRIHLWITGGLQNLPPLSSLPLVSSTSSSRQPKTTGIIIHHHHHHHPKQQQQQQQCLLPFYYYNLILMGLFNSLDFLGTNTSFFLSSASFVETIKASEPITTSAIAVFYGIEVLRIPEMISMGILVLGVFFSTLGNASSSNNNSVGSSSSTTSQGAFEDTTATATDDYEEKLHLSIKTALVILAANICFALRIKSQKILKQQPESTKVHDASILMWMQQCGAIVLIVPLIVLELDGIVYRTMTQSWEDQKSYIILSLINSWAFATYNLAQTYTLSKLSVAQFTLFGCLRRMFAIMFTSIVFGVPISMTSAFGIVLSLSGFGSFSYYRHHNPTTIATTTISSNSKSRIIAHKKNIGN